MLINVDTRERRGGNGFRPGEIKLTIHKFPFLQDQTLQDWVSGRVAQYRDLQEPPTQVSEPAEYGLGDYQGYLYAISDFSGEAQEIAIEVDGRVVLIGILPSDSPAYDEAIAILKSIKLYDFETCDRSAG